MSDGSKLIKPDKGELNFAEKKLDIGVLGQFFGSSTEKPGNIAGLTVSISLIALVLVVIMVFVVILQNGDSNFPLIQVMGVFGTIVSGALGFVFGRSK